MKRKSESAEVKKLETRRGEREEITERAREDKGGETGRGQMSLG